MSNKNKLLVLPIIFLLIGSPLRGGYTGVPFNRNDEIEQNLGLYNSSDKVISLTSENIKNFTMDQKYGTLLEFYNSFCGHCRRFAPKYKKFADEIYDWRNLIKVAAIDCADDQNNDICREFEVMAYPSLRYFKPFHLREKSQPKIGIVVNSQKIGEIKKIVINHAVNDSMTEDYWPNFSELHDANFSALFSNLSTSIEYVLILYENKNSTLASSLILDFSSNDAIQIRRTTNPDIAISFKILSPTTIAILDKNLNLQQINVDNLDYISFQNAIKNFLIEHNLFKVETPNLNVTPNFRFKNENNTALIDYVKQNGVHTVYKADLDYALYYTLFHEIPIFSNLSGDRLLALQRFVNILNVYNPLGKNGEKFMQKLKIFVMENNQNLSGDDLKSYVKKLTLESDVPLFTNTNKWIGCIGSKSNLRGFTCGLWKLFHFLTVQAAENDQTTDALEVLQAIHDYAKHFFGCTECSKHFQEMAVRRKIWNTATKDDAILWLWSAHNEVNERLAGDETDDPLFPKKQFPSSDSCAPCYNRDASTSSALEKITWNKQEVLNFMKEIYNPRNISYYGTDGESLENSKKLSQIMGNVFSDIDISVGFVLYGFCIIMMLFAVKLFIFRGYRRRPYPHNALGRV